ncbi:MAG: methionyl-tRNA formyltransferase [Rhodobiaceae bacterium]|nr:methionyl-tRNA formyltransferase [Rhodobiaceae bacterium]
MTLRVVFMGTPDFAVPTLTEITGAGHEVVAVYTQPPRKAGRGMAEKPAPVAEAAARFGIPVRTPLNFKDPAEVDALRDLDADIGVVAAYGLILPQAVLDAPRMGCLNLHASILPRWRGAAPIHRAVMAGDAVSGVCVMRMEAGLDTGPVGLCETVPIGPDMTTGDLHDHLARIGGDLMLRALGAMERDALTFVPQPDEGVTYAKKIDKAETRIDWARPAGEVHNHIRGLSPFPGAWFEVEVGGAPVRVKALASRLADGAGAPGMVLGDGLTIACGTGAVELVRVQRAGKASMDAADFLRGTGSLAGTVLD